MGTGLLRPGAAGERVERAGARVRGVRAAGRVFRPGILPGPDLYRRGTGVGLGRVQEVSVGASLGQGVAEVNGEEVAGHQDLERGTGCVFALVGRSGGTGRRRGLKIRWGQPRGGSNPPFGTTPGKGEIYIAFRADCSPAAPGNSAYPFPKPQKSNGLVDSTDQETPKDNRLADRIQ